jgi:DNA polymerase-3 subunit delta'
MLFDWLMPQWNRLSAAYRQHRLPHALLISGPEGIGKERLATELARALLCHAPDDAGFGCGRCSACRLFSAGTHPDVLWVRPKEAGKAIRIDQVRELGVYLTMTAHAGGRKVAVISPADALNLNAANSLLKTLEEPTDNTHILLVTAVPGRLPVTVRSRCQSVKCSMPSVDAARNWLSRELSVDADPALLLKMANGAPLLALELAQGDQVRNWLAFEAGLSDLESGKLAPATLAMQWSKQDGLQVLRWTRTRLATLIRTVQGTTPDDGSPLSPRQKSVAAIDNRKVFDLMDRVTFAINQWSSGLNTQLLLEDLLYEWVEVFGANRTSQVTRRQL